MIQLCLWSPLKWSQGSWEFFDWIKVKNQWLGHKLSSSSSPNCCNWLGITFDSNIVGRIVKLELSRNRLSGKISKSLSGLDQLKTLDLSFNFLRSPLPQSLLNFPNLEVLDLSNNNLFGLILANINLPSLMWVKSPFIYNKPSTSPWSNYVYGHPSFR